MSYRTQELQLQLPSSSVQDGTINILRFAELGTSLVITRGQLDSGETLHSHFQAQIGKLEKQVKELRASPVTAIQVGPQQSLEAVELQSQFSRGNERVYQYQLGILLADGHRLLALSYVKPQPLGEAEARHWAQIKHSLMLPPLE
ncbi:MAG: DcrB-related protein [Pseudomonas sp.]|uniref:DcrB-related protein n=1 Tax=Pseudomonas sp. TaxID=306 RepID=UPI00339AED09